MKKLFLSALTLSFSGMLLAQPTLSNANTATTIGESQVYYVADSNATDLSSVTGASATFDYSTLAGYGTTTSNTISDASMGAYAATYPNSTVEDILGSISIFRNNYTDSIACQGYAFVEPSIGAIEVVFDVDSLKLMEFPFTFGDSFTDDLDGEAIVPGFGTIPFSGQVTVTADAYGTLLLPNSVTYTNVLRVHTEENSVADTGIFGTIPVTRTQYAYYEPGTSKFPVFVHNTLSVSGNPQSYVLSRDPLPGLSTEEISLQNIKVFPNPAKDNLNVAFQSNESATISLFNVLGEEVRESNAPAGNSTIQFDVQDLEAGVYFIRIQTGTVSRTIKFVKE